MALAPAELYAAALAAVGDRAGLVERLWTTWGTMVIGSYGLYLNTIASRTNQRLRVLTFLSAVLLPMTVLTGSFGTNFARSRSTGAGASGGSAFSAGGAGSGALAGGRRSRGWRCLARWRAGGRSGSRWASWRGHAATLALAGRADDP